LGKLAEAYVEIGSLSGGLDKGLAASEQKLKDFVGRAQSLMAALGVGLGARGLMDVAEKGSNLAETMNKVKEVFRDSTSVVTGMADDMAAKFGSVKTVTLDAASNLGLVAQGAGLTAEKSAELSVRLTRLANDASSFFNVPLQDALEKIRSGMVGEAEPLRAFGVLLSDAAMKQEALASHIIPTNRELTEQEKVLARVEIITKGLSKAQGDAARTMDGYANSIRRLKGEWENFQAEAGQPLASGAADVLTARRGQQSVIADRGVLGALMLNLRAGFSKAAAGELADVMARGMTGDLSQPLRRPDGTIFARQLPGPGRESFEAFAMRTREADAFAAAPIFGGGGFGAFGMLGGIGQRVNGMGLDAEIARRQQAIQRGSWSGGWGAMSASDFVSSAQESILRPKDETAKKQLDELVKIREAVTKPKQPEAAGVVLRGRAN